jgi:uncharacterized OsmC-like protein
VEKLSAEVTGDIELEGKVLVIKRIHVAYDLTAADGDRETIERVHAVHKEGCPVYRSIHRAIDITTELRTA